MTTQQLFDLAMHTLETAQKITKLGGPTAEEALKGVEIVVDTFMAARNSNTPSSVPKDAAADITKIHDELAGDDDTIDLLIGDKKHA